MSGPSPATDRRGLRLVDVYLDVDGVVSPLVDQEPPGWGWARAQEARVGGLPVLWAPELVERLNALAALPHTRMHWLTSWESSAATHLCPGIGLHGEDWPVLHATRQPSWRYDWWKLSALDAHVSGRRVAWVDDDLGRYDDVTRWVRSQQVEVLALAPATATGLTPAEMDVLERFVG